MRGKVTLIIRELVSKSCQVKVVWEQRRSAVGAGGVRFNVRAVTW